MIVLVILIVKLPKSESLISFQQQALAGTLVAGAGNAIETDPFKRQQAGPPAGMSRSGRTRVAPGPAAGFSVGLRAHGHVVSVVNAAERGADLFLSTLEVNFFYLGSVYVHVHVY